MNKLFTKIVGVALGLTMAIGVGVAVGSNKEVTPVHAADIETTYTITSKTWTATSGGVSANWTSIADMNYDSGGKIGLSSGSASASSPKAYTGVKSFVFTGTKSKAGAGSCELFYGNASTDSWTSLGSKPFSTSLTWTISPNVDGHLKFSMTRTNGNIYIVSLKVVEVENVVLSSITLNTDNVQKSFVVGDTFNSTGLVTTAHYSNGTSETVTPTSISAPDMSTSGQKTVTVSYTEGEVTKTATYSITVNAPKTVNNFELLGGVSSGDTITVEAESTDTSVVGTAVFYLLKFSDNTYGAATLSWDNTDGLSNVDHYTNEEAGDDNGGYVEPIFTKNGIFTLTLSYATETPLEIKWKVKGFPTISYIDDTLTPTNVSNPSSYSAWSGKDKTIVGINSDAVYGGYSTGGTAKFQMRDGNNQSGIYSTQSGGKINKVSVVWHSDQTTSRSLIIYGNNSAFESISDITSGTEVGSIDFSDSETEYTLSSTQNFAYVAVYASGGGALYLSSITFTWAVEEAPTDTLKSIAISSEPTITTYYAGQSISANGYVVTATFEDDEENTYESDVTAETVWTISYPTALAIDEGTTKDVTFTASYTAGGVTETDSKVKTITIAVDSVTTLGWSNRGTIDAFSGTTLGDAVDTTEWTFTPTWASGKADTPSWGTGSDDVHVSLYATATPTAESETKLTSSYVLQASDNGKYLVAYYKGTRTNSNVAINVTKWRSVIEVASGHGIYNFSTVSGSSEITNTTVFNGYFNSEDGLTAPTVTLTKVYQATSAVRLATGSATGSIVFDFGSMKVSSVTIVAHGWSSSESECTMSITNGGTVTTTSDTSSDTFNVELSSPISSVTFSSAKNNRICIQSISFTASGSQEIGKTEDCLGLESFIDTYLHMDDYEGTEGQAGPGWCKDEEHNYYGKNTTTGAKYAFNSLNANQRKLFTTNSAYLAEWTRLQAWAAANGESLNSSSMLAAARISPFTNIVSNTNTITVIVIISMISVTAIGGYFFLRKRKEN